MKLKHACEDAGQYGVNVSPDEYRASGIRMIRTSDLAGGKLSTSSSGVFLDGPVPRYQILQKNDLLLSRAGTIGRSYLAPADVAGMTFAGFLVRFRPSDDVDPRFLQYAVQSKFVQQQIASEAVMSTIQNFNADRYANLDLPDAGRNQQRRIADFLDDRVSRIDRIIAARRQQLVLDADLRSELMRLGVGGVLRDSMPTKATSIGWLERMHCDGEEVRLSRVVTLQRGVDLTEDQRRPGSVQVITTAGVVGTHDEPISSGPGVVIGRYGSVGNVHWVEGPYWPHNTTLYVLATHGNRLRWVYYLLESFPFKSLQARAAVPGVNRNDMAVEMVPWIPLSLQDSAIFHLDSVADDFTNRASSLNASIDLLTEYKSSLVTAAVTGELDVTTAGSNLPG